MRTGETYSEFSCDPWGQGQRGVAPKGPKFILYRRSHVAYQIEGYEEKNIVVQKFFPGGGGGMSGGH